MLSDRCKKTVSTSLKKMGLHFAIVNLGEVWIKDSITIQQREELNFILNESGLELIEDKEAMLFENMKKVIIEMVHSDDDLRKKHFSDHLSQRLNGNYSYLSNLFSRKEGSTLKQFILRHKIERVKQLLLSDELNLTEIAWKLNYSSVGHLSAQFLSITGITPSLFKSIQNPRNKAYPQISE